MLNQSFHDIEVIILDDCSDDKSREIIQGYLESDKRVKAYYNTQNSGSPFKQWNKGVGFTSGDYIWIAESDDYAELNFLKKTVAVLDKYENVGIVNCQSYDVDETDLIRGTWDKHTDSIDPVRWKSNFYGEGRAECEKYMLFKTTIPNASAVLFRKSVFITAGGANESYKMCGDWLLWLKMLMYSDIFFIAEKLNYFRSHYNTTRSNIFSDPVKFSQRFQEYYKLYYAFFSEYKFPDTVKSNVCSSAFQDWIWMYNLRSLKAGYFWKLCFAAARVDNRLPWRLLSFIKNHLMYKCISLKRKARFS